MTKTEDLLHFCCVVVFTERLTRPPPDDTAAQGHGEDAVFHILGLLSVALVVSAAPDRGRPQPHRKVAQVGRRLPRAFLLFRFLLLLLLLLLHRADLLYTRPQKRALLERRGYRNRCRRHRRRGRDHGHHC